MPPRPGMRPAGRSGPGGVAAPRIHRRLEGRPHHPITVALVIVIVMVALFRHEPFLEIARFALVLTVAAMRAVRAPQSGR